MYRGGIASSEFACFMPASTNTLLVSTRYATICRALGRLSIHNHHVRSESTCLLSLFSSHWLPLSTQVRPCMSVRSSPAAWWRHAGGAVLAEVRQTVPAKSVRLVLERRRQYMRLYTALHAGDCTPPEGAFGAAGCGPVASLSPAAAARALAGLEAQMTVGEVAAYRTFVALRRSRHLAASPEAHALWREAVDALGAFLDMIPQMAAASGDLPAARSAAQIHLDVRCPCLGVRLECGDSRSGPALATRDAASAANGKASSAGGSRAAPSVQAVLIQAEGLALHAPHGAPVRMHVDGLSVHAASDDASYQPYLLKAPVAPHHAAAFFIKEPKRPDVGSGGSATSAGSFTGAAAASAAAAAAAGSGTGCTAAQPAATPATAPGADLREAAKVSIYSKAYVALFLSRYDIEIQPVEMVLEPVVAAAAMHFWTQCQALPARGSAAATVATSRPAAGAADCASGSIGSTVSKPVATAAPAIAGSSSNTSSSGSGGAGGTDIADGITVRDMVLNSFMWRHEPTPASVSSMLPIIQLACPQLLLRVPLGRLEQHLASDLLICVSVIRTC